MSSSRVCPSRSRVPPAFPRIAASPLASARRHRVSAVGLWVACIAACTEHATLTEPASTTSETGTSESSPMPDDDPMSSPSGGPEATHTNGSDASSSDAGDASESSGPPVCGGACIALPPGWSGPVVVHEAAASEPPPVCTGSFGAVEFTRFADLEAPDAECGCTCGEAQGTTCPDALLVRTSANCLASDGALVLEEGCTNVPNEADQDWRVPIPMPDGGHCSPSATAERVPAEFGAQVVACSPTEGAAGECTGDDACVPEADAPLCVWALGELACPDAFPTQRLAFGGVEDTRGCSPCSCGEPHGECDMSPVVLSGLNDSCGVIQGSPVLVLDPGECGHFGATLLSVDLLEAPTPDVACTPSVVEPTGSVATTDAVTVCCAA